MIIMSLFTAVQETIKNPQDLRKLMFYGPKSAVINYI
jgi:hypothetical protein